MDDFTNKPKPAITDDKPGGRLNLDSQQEASVTLWAYVATVMYVCFAQLKCLSIESTFLLPSLLILATPMIFFPNFLLYISESSLERRNALTPLESYLSLNSGILLATLALALLFNVRFPIFIPFPVPEVCHRHQQALQ